MGWSCSRRAYDTLERLQADCREDSGVSNTFIENERKYFFEIGAEQADGAIIGDVWEVDGPKTGDFRIEPDGTISHFAELLGGSFE